MGTIPLLQVGCAPADDQSFTPASGTPATASVSAAEQQQLCARAMETEDPRDVEALLLADPSGGCVNATLIAMPAATLTQVSPAVLNQLPASVQRNLPNRAKVYLRLPDRSSSNSSSGGGGGGSGAY
ncbi:hypothetical protein [Amaricoccus tamworthensis]|uniref:hypothetical protein n=1 Tax=Amaricoccus tamworthensis TaxID=57002 RepID=UPI003C7B9891